MTRGILIIAVLSLVFAVGCEEEVSDDSRFKVDPAQEAIAISEGFAVPDASEVDYVEDMAGYRNAYRDSLERLTDYYRSMGDATKQTWAKREFDSFMRMVHYHYIMPAEAAFGDLRATDSIAQADMLYEETMKLYREAGGLLIIIDDGKFREALNKFNLLISSYPCSDKIDDSAFRAGQIYEHFKDYEIAAVYYQRAFQWSETTPYPARFKAAYVLDRHLHMRKEALALYQMAYEKEARYKANTEYAKKRIMQMTRPRIVLQPEEEIIEEQPIEEITQ